MTFLLGEEGEDQEEFLFLTEKDVEEEEVMGKEKERSKEEMEEEGAIEEQAPAGGSVSPGP